VEPSEPIPRDGYSVYCIACRTVYVKPCAGDGTGVDAGCPACGGAGWVAVAVTAAPAECGAAPAS
jgi:hypothetical protein